jgi:C1A family cysteine protease
MASAPTSYDARRLNLVVTPPGDQVDCGACVTYALTSAAESALGAQLKLRSLIKLSEQDLFFCGEISEWPAAAAAGVWLRLRAVLVQDAAAGWGHACTALLRDAFDLASAMSLRAVAGAVCVLWGLHC